jgi:ribosomal protein S18 acetylase RimI-like enzyme
MSDAPLHLAPLTEGHLDSCAAIVGGLELFRRYELTADRARRLLAVALEEGRAELLVLEAPGDPPVVAGFVWFVPRGAFDRSGYLRLIAVDDRFQGRGVGKQLLAELERRHLQRGGIVLLASATNSEAHRFYERLGYRHVGELPDYVKPGLHERIYYKPAPR